MTVALIAGAMVFLGVSGFLRVPEAATNEDHREKLRLQLQMAGLAMGGVIALYEFTDVTAAPSASVTLAHVDDDKPVALCTESVGDRRYLRLSAKTRVTNNGNTILGPVFVRATLRWADADGGAQSYRPQLVDSGTLPVSQSQLDNTLFELGEIQPDTFRERMVTWFFEIPLDSQFERNGLIALEAGEGGEPTGRTRTALVDTCVREGDGECKSGTGLAGTAVRLDAHWLSDVDSCAPGKPHIEMGSCWVGDVLSAGADGTSFSRAGCEQLLRYRCATGADGASISAMWQSSLANGDAAYASCVGQSGLPTALTWTAIKPTK